MDVKNTNNNDTEKTAESLFSSCFFSLLFPKLALNSCAIYFDQFIALLLSESKDPPCWKSTVPLVTGPILPQSSRNKIGHEKKKKNIYTNNLLVIQLAFLDEEHQFFPTSMIYWRKSTNKGTKYQWPVAQQIAWVETNFIPNKKNIKISNGTTKHTSTFQGVPVIP